MTEARLAEIEAALFIDERRGHSDPDEVRELVAEVRRLRAALETVIAEADEEVARLEAIVTEHDGRQAQK